MSKKGQPFLPMFVGDFFAATAEWEGEEEALYALLLMRQWAIGHLPCEVSKLARLVKFDPRNFERWWPTVSTKFEVREVDGFGERLVNPRLEQHRAKSLALSEKNAQAGKRGAERKWHKDGERHQQGMANATPNDGERHKSANGVTDGNPSHPIPSHPIPSHPDPSGVLPPSSQASDTHTPSKGEKPGVGFRTGSRDSQRGPEPAVESGVSGQQTAEPWSDAQYAEAFAVLKAAYPRKSGHPADWNTAEHHWRLRLEEGIPPRELLGGVERYRAFVDAGGVSDSTRVKCPSQFFLAAKRFWREPWDPPPSRQQARQDENVDAARAFIARGAA